MDVPEPVRIEVEAPSACLTSGAFLERVRARAPRVTEARPSERAVTYRVTVAVSEQGAEGSVVTVGGEPRSVSGGSCLEVVEALALTVALSVDPSGSPAVQPAPAPPSTPDLPRARDERSSVETPPRSHLRASLGAQGSVTSMGSLGALAAPELFGSLTSATPSIVAPQVRLAASTRGGDAGGIGGRAELRWWVARLDGCILQFRLAWSTVLRPCLGVEGGTLSADGLAITNAASSRTVWLAVRGAANVTWSVTNNAFLLASAGLDAPVTRHRFLFAPTEVLFSVPPVMPFAALGAGLTFP